MIDVHIDRNSVKGSIRIGGEPIEIANDFMNLFNEIYKTSPTVFLIIIQVLGDLAEKLEEELENDQNNTSDNG